MREGLAVGDSLLEDTVAVHTAVITVKWSVIISGQYNCRASNVEGKK